MLQPECQRHNQRPEPFAFVTIFDPQEHWASTVEDSVCRQGHRDESGREAWDPRYFTVSFFKPADLPSSITSTS